MVEIGRCSSCGTYTSEVWSKNDNCKECGGSTDHMKIELGQIEFLPRFFNIGGGLVFLIGLILFFVSFASDSIGSAYLFFLFGGILLFIISLISQYFIVRKAIERASILKISRKKTRKSGPAQKKDENEDDVKAGQMKGDKRVAKKVMIGK